MQQITNITLYADRPNNVTVYAKQDDADTRVVVATLFDGSSPLDTSDVETGSVKIRRPSGTGCMLDVDDIDGNVITFTLKGQALTVPGEAEGEYIIMFDDWLNIILETADGSEVAPADNDCTVELVY